MRGSLRANGLPLSFKEMNMDTLPSLHVQGNHIDIAISVWLDAKYRRSNSNRTRDLYERILHGFRRQLQSIGLDLDPVGNLPQHATEEELDSMIAFIAVAAQGYASHSEHEGQQIAPGTYANRLAILSSFYDLAISRKFMRCANPIRGIERPKLQAFKNAVPIDPAIIADRMRRIDRSRPEGKRDYAMLSLYLQTGRRLNEVVSLRWQQVEVQGDIVTITFHCKGGKVMRDKLPVSVGKTLLEWLASHYGSLGTLQPDTPLWVSTKRQSKSGALTMRSVSNICEKRLGFSEVHTTRHTWARTMEDKGAKVSDIQYRLGHESLATTGKYLAALRQSDNEFADAISSAFGLE